jgi:CheY-like chemotaxis protein
VRVLLVEDNPGDARLIQEALREGADPAARGDAVELQHATTLTEALRLLASDAPGASDGESATGGVPDPKTPRVGAGKNTFDAVLLDLNLPESQGLETFRTVRRAAPGVAQVVLSGVADEAVGVQAVREGAQDYLVKGEADGRLVERSLRYAVERQRAEQEHAGRVREEAARREAEAALREERERRDRQERELQALQRLSGPPRSPITSQTYGVQSLRVAAPEEFDRLAAEYGETVDLALEQRGYRVEHDLSGRLRELAARLGFLGAGPRDVVELHSVALRARVAEAPAARVQALVEEARVLVLELMGHLVSYYRSRPAREASRSPRPA